MIAVVLALLLVAWRFFGVSLVDQVLGVAIVVNVALFLLTNAADEAAHEVAIIVPFGAALAARMLIRATGAAPAPKGTARRVRLAALVAGIVVLAGYTAGFGYELAQPSVPPANTSLASWLRGPPSHLRAQRLLDEQQRHREQRPAGQGQGPHAVHAEARTCGWPTWTWYNPKLHYANFVVLDSQPGTSRTGSRAR